MLTRRKNLDCYLTEQIDKSESQKADSAELVNALEGGAPRSGNAPGKPNLALEEIAKRRQYHKVENQIKGIKTALACIDTSVDPRALAIHMKNHHGLGRSVDIALEWLIRFAEELQERGNARY